MKKLLTLVIASVVLVSCQNYNRTRVVPESLLSSSSENVSFSLTDDSSINSIFAWAEEDIPTSAQIACKDTEGSLCRHAQELMDGISVPYSVSRLADGNDSVVLVYERITARDCSNSGFGCSISVNSVQMVTDDTQFTSPPLSSPQDAAKAVERYNHYMMK